MFENNEIKFIQEGFIFKKKIFGSGGIRTHAPEETGALNQRLRPLGHPAVLISPDGFEPST